MTLAMNDQRVSLQIAKRPEPAQGALRRLSDLAAF
jgi:hypothetical protein